jgi:hypothetical protein
MRAASWSARQCTASIARNGRKLISRWMALRCARRVDALSVRYGYGDGAGAKKRALATTPNHYQVLDRRAVSFPPIRNNNAMVGYNTAVGTLAELAVDATSGKVALLTHHTILECGNMLVPELVSGQLQGGVASGRAGAQARRRCDWRDTCPARQRRHRARASARPVHGCRRTAISAPVSSRKKRPRRAQSCRQRARTAMSPKGRAARDR